MKNLKAVHYNVLLGVIFFLTFSALFYTASTLSIGYSEAIVYFDKSNLLHFLVNFSTNIFGQNDIALRLPLLIFYFLSIILIYLITQKLFTKDFDRFVTVVVFMILPGILSASLIVNESIIVIFCVLLYLYLYENTKKHNYILLVLFLFIDNAFAVLYLALFFYSLRKKDNILLVTALILFAISMSMYGFDTGGKPKGHFLQILGIYASIFSPFVFFYFFYAQYRISIKGPHNIYWYISIVAFGFSLILSFRQKILIEDFAPFVLIAVPMMVQLFLHSFRVRLPRFQSYHKVTAYVSLSILAITSMIILFNKPFYMVLTDPQRHFAYNYHHAKEIAHILKENKIDNIYSSDSKLIKRLQFYGISEGYDYFIDLQNQNIYDFHFTIDYNQHKLIDIFVTKLNNN